MVPKAPIGIRMFETIKSMLSKMVPAPIFTPLKLLNERVAGMLITNTNTLPINATGLRLRLSFLVKLETFNSNNEIEDVNAANKTILKR